MFKKVMVVAWIACLPTLTVAQPEGPLQPEVGGMIGLPMYLDPDVRPPEAERVFDPRLKSLWTSALARPEADLRWQAAAAFGEAATRGMTGLDAVVPVLAARLREDDVPEVRAAAASALAAIGDASAAEAMLEADRRAAADAEMVLIIDPALAAWRYEPAFALWQQRLTDPATPVVVAASAARSLGAAGASSARDALLERALAAQGQPIVRIAAAKALHALGADVALAEIEPLMDGTPVQRIVAAHLLAGEPAGKGAALEQLAGGAEPVAAAIAAAVLAQVDPPAAMRLADHAEPAVRLQAVRAAWRHPSATAIRLLIDRLDDPSTTVRLPAREALEDLGGQSRWGEPVREGLTRLLRDRGDVWRGLEQAALAAGKLDLEPVGQALLDLLEHDRAEVSLAAANALRELADPTTLSAVLEHARRLTTAAGQTARPARAEDAQRTPLSEHAISSAVRRGTSIANDTTQLFMLLGELAYAPADPLLRQYIPKASPFSGQARAAAIWALGKIHAGEPEEALLERFADRVGDIYGQQPESDLVRQMSAISIGRMKGTSQLPTLRRFASDIGSSQFARAALWAIAQLEGTAVQFPPTEKVSIRGWFLEPAE